MREPIVIDDFYRDPESIRDFALALPKLDFPGAPYAGVQSDMGYFTPEIKDRFSDIIGEQVSFRQGVDVFGSFRISCEGDRGRTHVHFDSARWAAVVYLSDSDVPLDGTIFYRHKRTGLLGPQEDYDSPNYSVHRQQLIEDIVVPDTLDDSAWEQTEAIPHKFNRLIIFQGWQRFHSAGPSFGSSFETGRLTQQFFFDTTRLR